MRLRAATTRPSVCYASTGSDEHAHEQYQQDAGHYLAKASPALSERDGRRYLPVPPTIFLFEVPTKRAQDLPRFRHHTSPQAKRLRSCLLNQHAEPINRPGRRPAARPSAPCLRSAACSSPSLPNFAEKTRLSAPGLHARVYLLASISISAHLSATLLSDFFSPGIVAQPCFST